MIQLSIPLTPGAVPLPKAGSPLSTIASTTSDFALALADLAAPATPSTASPAPPAGIAGIVEPWRPPEPSDGAPPIVLPETTERQDAAAPGKIVPDGEDSAPSDDALLAALMNAPVAIDAKPKDAAASRPRKAAPIPEGAVDAAAVAATAVSGDGAAAVEHPQDKSTHGDDRADDTAPAATAAEIAPAILAAPAAATVPAAEPAARSTPPSVENVATPDRRVGTVTVRSASAAVTPRATVMPDLGAETSDTSAEGRAASRAADTRPSADGEPATPLTPPAVAEPPPAASPVADAPRPAELVSSVATARRGAAIATAATPTRAARMGAVARSANETGAAPIGENPPTARVDLPPDPVVRTVTSTVAPTVEPTGAPSVLLRPASAILPSAAIASSAQADGASVASAVVPAIPVAQVAPTSQTAQTAQVVPVAAAAAAVPVATPGAAEVLAGRSKDTPAVTFTVAAPDPAPARAPAAEPRPAAQAFAAAIFAIEQDRKGSAREVAVDPLSAQPGASAMATTSAAPQIAHAVAQPHGATLDLGRQDWMGRMIDHIETLSDASGGRETRIRLAPDALGTVDIAIHQDDAGLTVRITAETPQARAILSEAAPRLAEMAEARGLKLGAQVDGAGTTGTGAGQAGSQHREARQPDTPTPVRPPSATPTDAGDDSVADVRIA